MGPICWECGPWGMEVLVYKACSVSPGSLSALPEASHPQPWKPHMQDPHPPHPSQEQVLARDAPGEADRGHRAVLKGGSRKGTGSGFKVHGGWRAAAGPKPCLGRHQQYGSGHSPGEAAGVGEASPHGGMGSPSLPAWPDAALPWPSQGPGLPTLAFWAGWPLPGHSAAASRPQNLRPPEP